MKKIIFTLMVIASTIFVSCNAPTEIKVVELSTGKTELGATFTDFFDPVELVHFSSDNISSAIVMDKNTGVLYVRKSSGYQWGMSPIYDSDGSVLTKEKWLAKRAEN
jgi:uncharacterized lipoprotein NlpE involved in copper resistance